MNSDFLNLFDVSLQSGQVISPLSVLLRLLAALLLGGVVAVIYRKTAQNSESSASFPITLILLSILIAMVTQVIGNNVALAFSLVGALSVVRFRTVVRDTRDTAYVIFAVVVGMAVGAANLWVAVLGIVVIGISSWLVERGAWLGVASDTYLLRMRSGLGHDPAALAAGVLEQYLASRQLVGVITSRQGTGLEYSFEVILKPNADMAALVKALSLIEGIQDIRFERREES